MADEGVRRNRYPAMWALFLFYLLFYSLHKISILILSNKSISKHYIFKLLWPQIWTFFSWQVGVSCFCSQTDTADVIFTASQKQHLLFLTTWTSWVTYCMILLIKRTLWCIILTSALQSLWRCCCEKNEKRGQRHSLYRRQNEYALTWQRPTYILWNNHILLFIKPQ